MIRLCPSVYDGLLFHFGDLIHRICPDNIFIVHEKNEIMRLSLKTILAYTDNLFDAEYLPIVKKRIGDEEAAGRLMERIHSVSSNPQLSVPGRSGDDPELSANLVAAYLDHQLSESEQAQFEAICLRSDVFLAEVACAHQVLTTRLGQPAPLSRECRLRSYAISQRSNYVPIATETNDDQASHQGSTDHPDIVPMQTDVSETVIHFEVDSETVPKSVKKRRITVVSQNGVVSVQSLPEPHHAEREPKEEQPNIQYVPDAVRNGEVPAERLTFYPTNRLPKDGEFDTLAKTTNHDTDATKDSRLGQAFDRLKHRKRMMYASLLMLLFLCVAMFAVSRYKSPTDHQIVTQKNIQQPLQQDPVQIDGEKDNKQRFADNSIILSNRNETPTTPITHDHTATNAVFSAHVDSEYALRESPESVMQYMPGEANRPLEQYMIAQIPTAAQNIASQQPSNHLLSDGSANHIQIANATTTSPWNGLPSSVQPSLQQPSIPLAAQTSPVFLSPGNLSSLQDTSTQQFRADITHAEPGVMLQLIDRGSAQSVSQFIRHELPAIRTATPETGYNTVPSPINTENGGNYRHEMLQQSRERNTERYTTDDQALLPRYRMIEQVSFLASDTQEPPLVEPNWNVTNHGSFESLPSQTSTTDNVGNTATLPVDTPVLQHGRMTETQLTSPRQPGSYQHDALRANNGSSISQPIMRSENRSTIDVTWASTEDKGERSGNLPHDLSGDLPNIATSSDEPVSLVRMPGNIASSDVRLTPLSSIRNSQAEMSEIIEPAVNSPVLQIGKEDIALIRDTNESEWSWLPISKQLTIGNIVLVPAPFNAVVRFANGMTIETAGDTRIQILPPDEKGRPMIAFDYGHLIVSLDGKQRAKQAETIKSTGDLSQSLRIVTPVGSGILRLTDTQSFASIDSENRTSVKLLKVTRPYESVTSNPVFYETNIENNVTYCPNLVAFPANKHSIFWHKDGNDIEWELAAVSVFPIDVEKIVAPIIVYDTNNLVVTPSVVWPALVSHDGNIPISKLDLKNQFVTMPNTFYPTPSKIWLLK